jgi:hypothetical protein
MTEIKGKAIKLAAINLVVCSLVLSMTMTAVAQESSSSRASDPQKQWLQGDTAPKTVVLYGFADVTDVAMLSDGPVKETCSHALDPSANMFPTKTKPLTTEQQAQLADNVAEELANGLEKRIPVIYAQPPEMPAAGSLVFTGCFVNTDPGSTSKRLVGAGLGSSHLSAHVRVFYAGASGPVPVDEFDVAVNGSNKVPALGTAGLAFNAFRAKRSTLPTDATQLADQILKKLQTDQVL